MNLILHIQENKEAVYTGYFEGKKELYGIITHGRDYSIIENTIDWDTTKVYYTENIRR